MIHQLVKCPHCKKMHEYSQKNPFRPFCSKRCKLIDLGQWADEKFRIPAEETVPGSQENPSSPERGDSDDEEI